MNMQTVKLGSLGTIYDGPHATPVRRDTGAYFLSISSLNSGRLDLSLSDRVDEEDFRKWTRRVKPKEDDLLFSYETRLGQAALMPAEVEACLGRRMALLRPNSDRVRPRFLLYAWMSPMFRAQINERSVRGATVDRIPLNELAFWELPLPCLLVQDAIGEMLGALDDKAAANRLAMESSDELIRVLYSRLPLSRLTLDRVAINVREPVGSADIATDEMYIGLEHLDRRSLWLNGRGVGADVASGKSRFVAGDVLFGKLRPYFHKVVLAPSAGVCSTDILVVRPCEPRNMALVAASASSDAVVAAAVQASNGTKMPRAKWADIATCSVPDPETAEARAFSALADPLSKRVDQAVDENLRLTATRDELLPLLMSGKITVKDAEKTVEEVV